MELKGLKKYLKTKNLKKYGPWWGRFSSALVATVCGIALTIGVGQCNSNREKEKLVRISEVVAMADIRKSIDELDKIIGNIDEKIAIIDSVLQMFPDSLHMVPRELAEDFMNSHYMQFYALDKSAEQLFMTSTDVRVNSKSVSEVASICELFSMLNVSISIWDEMNADMKQIIEEKVLEFNDKAIDPDIALRTFLSCYKDYWRYQEYMLKASLLKHYTENLQNAYKDVFNALSITEEEIKSCTSTVGDIELPTDSL